MQSDPKRRFCKRQFINGKPVISVGIDFAQVIEENGTTDG
jgi:hypothetical protein